MSREKILSIRLTEGQQSRLDRYARRHNDKYRAEAGARLVEEGLRRDEFPSIDFRDTPYGRQAFVEGTGLPVWELVATWKAYKEDAEATARALAWPSFKVHAALNYAREYAGEINETLEFNESVTLEDVRRMVPGMEIFQVSDEDLDRIVEAPGMDGQ